MSNNSRTFVVSNYITMKATNTQYLVKEHVSGFVMITGTLKGQVFKAKNSRFKINTNLLTKDEKLFANDFSARVHADMLNNIID